MFNPTAVILSMTGVVLYPTAVILRKT